MFPCLTFYSRYLGQILSEMTPLRCSFCGFTIPTTIGITPRLKLIAAHLLCIDSLSSCLRAAIVHRIFDSVDAITNLHCNDEYIYQPPCDLYHLRTSVLPLEMIVCRVGVTPNNSAKPGWIWKKHLECIRIPRILYLLFHPYLLELSIIHLPSIFLCAHIRWFAERARPRSLDSGACPKSMSS